MDDLLDESERAPIGSVIATGERRRRSSEQSSNQKCCECTAHGFPPSGRKTGLIGLLIGGRAPVHLSSDRRGEIATLRKLLFGQRQEKTFRLCAEFFEVLPDVVDRAL